MLIFDEPPRPMVVPPPNKPMDPPLPQAAPVMSIHWLMNPSVPRAQHYALPSQNKPNIDAPWSSPFNMSGNTSTTDEEHRDSMARDKGKAREMPDSDVYGGSHRQWRDD